MKKIKSTVKDVKEDFYTFTTKASEITRQLALAGVGIIWLFMKNLEISGQGLYTLKLLILCLVLDFLHAVVPSFLYGYLDYGYRKKENKSDASVVEYIQIIEWPEWILFSLKVFFVVYAYIELWQFLTAILVVK